MGVREKNSNKKNRINGCKRKYIYKKIEGIASEPSKAGREELAKYEDKTITFSGTLKVKYSRLTTKPILLEDVHVDGEYVTDHVWVILSVPQQKKLRKFNVNEELCFQGTVALYPKVEGKINCKYGFKNVVVCDDIPYGEIIATEA